MTDMMILQHGYVLVFRPSDVRKSCQGIDHPRDCVVKKEMPTKLVMCVTA